MIYTFYSFKGGVGRSMALANIAELLYARGLKVLMVDFDLEAPGLERYFNVPKAVTRPREVLTRRGVIDMLLSYAELNSLAQFGQAAEARAAGPRAGSGAFRRPAEPLGQFVVPVYEKNALGGELSLIPAGRRDGDEFTEYARRIRSFDWDDFYESLDGEDFFEWLRGEMEAFADVVLIDSRTGVSEMSGACTYLLADTVVMFVAPNQQNLDGTATMAESLSNPELIEQRGRPLSLLFVPSRVEHVELRLFDDFAKRFKKMFGGANFGARPAEGASFDDLKLIYIPYFSYMEKVAVREPESAGAADMIKAYEKIASTLALMEPEDGHLRKTFHPSTAERRARIFISYRRGEPDESIARELHAELSKSHDVFFDQTLPVGAVWARDIREEMGRADFFVTLISPAAVNSEVFLSEVELAHGLASSSGGRPAILPVRVDYSAPLPYPLSAYLNHIQHAYWSKPADTPRLAEDLLNAISGGGASGRSQAADAATQHARDLPLSVPPFDTPQPERLESSEGVVDLQSPFYVTRPADSTALAAITRQGVTITIKGPEQMGKSSLLFRTVDAAARAGKKVAFIDFQIIEKKVLKDAEFFLREFCQLISNELGLEDQDDTYWRVPLSFGQRCTRYMSQHVLERSGQPIVLAMDEVDVLFDSPFRADFFGMLRSWHNSRGLSPLWKQLDLLLVTSTEPYQFIDNMNQSPFNVGEVLELEDFTAEQVADLNRRHGSPLQPSEVTLLTDLLGGHPYLVRRALYLLASRTMNTDQFFTQAAHEHGPFGAHLRRHLMRLNGREDLVAALLEVITKHTCSDERLFHRLRGAGLVRREDAQRVLPRCALYADYFKERLDV